MRITAAQSEQHPLVTWLVDALGPRKQEVADPIEGVALASVARGSLVGLSLLLCRTGLG
jgi:hypothetical protein